jgi:hypothetical protein
MRLKFVKIILSVYLLFLVPMPTLAVEGQDLPEAVGLPGDVNPTVDQPSSAKDAACQAASCAPTADACSIYMSPPLTTKSGGAFCLDYACGGSTCHFTKKPCTIEEDCKGYGFNQLCFNNYCFLDDVGLQKYNAKADLGITDLNIDLQIKKPILSINIPQLNFSDLASSTATQEGGDVYIHIPYIGEYISAIYKVGMVVASIIGVIMIVVVGIKITVLGGEERVNGFKRIGQIIIGLFIAWGSYAILYNINPDLVSFKALKIKYIESEEIEFGPITLTDDDLSQGDSGGPYQFKYFNDCPVQLTNQTTFSEKNPKKPGDIRKNIPKRIEFHDKLLNKKLLTGPISQRVLMAVEATTKCQIQYENCGVGTTNMYALVASPGSYGDSCLKNSDPKTPCNILGNSHGNIKKNMLHSVLSTKTSYGMSVSKLLRGFYCPSVPQCKGNISWKEQCFSDKGTAASKLTSILNATGKWSPNWVDELQPGDYYMIVNWNPSCQATHSAMFLGWKDKANRVAWVEMGDAANFLRIGTKKFTAADLVIQVSRPVDK